jgi:hypothetical protein
VARSFNFPKFKAGEPLLPQLSAERLNAIIDALDRNRVEFGDNVTGQRTPGGTIVRANAKGGGGDGDFPFQLTIGKRPADPTLYRVRISDGKVNNEWPDVGDDAMGVTGSRYLNIENVANSNIFIRVMFNALTNHIERLDIYEKPNETYPSNKITALVSGEDPVPGACDDVDLPTADPPAGYGSIYIMLGFTYLQPPPPGSPEGTESTPQAFNLRRDHQNFEFVYGSNNGLPAVLLVDVPSGWTRVPEDLPPEP